MEHRSKWDVLQARLAEHQKAAFDIQSQLQWMVVTDLNIPCSGCGTIHKTEADFAQHYLIPDERFLNLGYCPNKQN